MKIDSIRIYSEVLEQGFDFKEYLSNIDCLKKIPIVNIYANKSRLEITEEDSIVERIKKSKDIDVLITAICKEKEYPLLLVEYSTAVPTDDHKMQRSDVYFWGGIYQVPTMKIFPADKGMDKDFGGGDRITDEFEIAIAMKKNSVFFPVKWFRDSDSSTLKIKKKCLSCIEFNTEIETILINLFLTFIESVDAENFFKQMLSSHRKNNKLPVDLNAYAKSIIVNSTRFKWTDDKLVCKINRFGHAMDPDRGILYFANMILGAENVITEFQVNRNSNVNARGGYKALFDSLSREAEMLNYIKNIIDKKNNIFTASDALHVFLRSLNLENYLHPKLIDEKAYTINDEELLNYFIKSKGMTAKCIFFLSTKLILTDKNRKIICSINWNPKVIEKYLEKLSKSTLSPLQITDFTMEKAKEDIVTFTSVELYKKMNCNLLAVSYPGAQGDRCILIGKGRKVLRVYVDIIAFKQEQNKIVAYLQENKENLANSTKDVTKLLQIKNDVTYRNGLVTAFNKLARLNHVDDIFTSLGGKTTQKLKPLDVDYIIMIDIENTEFNTLINWQIAIINTNLIKNFDSLININGRLAGTITLDKVYMIE